MPNFYPIARPLFSLLPAEPARDLTIGCLRAGLGGLMVDSSAQQPDAPSLSQRLWNLDFPNPVGLAAGFDKDARVPDAVLRHWRCGFAEVGTVTPRPQNGNKKPRVFRLRKDNAIINRMGFNSRGLAYVVEQLAKRTEAHGIVGVNLGKNRNDEDTIADYEKGIVSTANLASYLVVNISSPNTPGLRDLQRRAPLEALLSKLIVTRDRTNTETPLLVKIAPDLSPEEAEDIASVAVELGIDGIVVSNTTTDRPPNLASQAAREEGGLSGRPLFAKSTRLLALLFTLTEGKIPLIGVGGIADANDAYEKICAGASLVQLYTAVAFRGPMLITEIKRGIGDLLKANHLSSIRDAVGTKSSAWVSESDQRSPARRLVIPSTKPPISTPGGVDRPVVVGV